MPDTKRKLAHVEKIKWKKPIEGADSIELVGILGWQCISKINEFEVGDSCIFIEIDAILPNFDSFKFMESSKFRVRTKRLLKNLSQGLAMPLDILAEDSTILDFITNSGLKIPALSEGADLTELLGIKLYEPPINEGASLRGKIKRAFPTHLFPKTDEERIQNIPNVLDETRNSEYVVTEKLDGTSMTCYFFNGEFGVCGRNVDYDLSVPNSYIDMAIKLNIENKLKDFGKNVAIQGELVGPSINGNRLKLKEKNWYVFDIFDIDKQEYFGHSEFIRATYLLGLEHAPYYSSSFIMNHSTEELLNLANCKSLTFGEINIEGLVFRLKYGNNSRNRISFKVINNNYLLKYE